MKRATALLLSLFSVSFIAASPTSKPTNVNADRIDERLIANKWEVTSVKRDGKPQHGQVGQEVGDVITIMMHGGQLELG